MIRLIGWCVPLLTYCYIFSDPSDWSDLLKCVLTAMRCGWCRKKRWKSLAGNWSTVMCSVLQSTDVCLWHWLEPAFRSLCPRSLSSVMSLLTCLHSYIPYWVLISEWTRVFSRTWLRYIWLMAWQIRLSVVSVVCDVRAPYSGVELFRDTFAQYCSLAITDNATYRDRQEFPWCKGKSESIFH